MSCRQIDHAALQLQAVGVRPGDRVAMLSRPSPALAAAIVGCWRIGAVAVPLSPRYPNAAVGNILSQLRCRVLISDAGTAAPVRVSVHSVDEIAGSDAGFGAVLLDDLDIDLQNDADILMTSGSTGQPRGVLHTISNHYHNALGAHENTPFGPDDRWLMSLPMHHVSGLSLLMRAMLHGGGIVFPKPDEGLAEALSNCKISHLSLVPVQLARLLESPEAIEKLRRLQVILLGGSAAPGRLVEKSLSLDLPIHTTYGSTEMASQVTTTAAGSLEAKPTSSGRLLPYRQMKITTGGEITVKGPCLCRGYIQGDQLQLPLDSEGFFATGDLGSLDDNGDLFVIGRKDLMFISGGENIYPEQIEILLEADETVRRAIVVGVTVDTMGDRPVAFIETVDGDNPDEAILGESLRQQVEGFKVPIAFFAMPEEMSQACKIDRRVLRDIAVQQMRGR